MHQYRKNSEFLAVKQRIDKIGTFFAFLYLGFFSSSPLNGQVEKEDWESRFIQQNVIWKYSGHGPHAEYSLSGKHSDFYFNSNYIVCNPDLLREVCLSLFRQANQELTTKPDWVVTYPPFGLSIGFCLAELFECKFAYITSLDQPDLPFDIQKNENVLFCADDLYSGGSFFKVLRAIESKEANLLNPLIVIGNFSGGSTFKGYDVISLMEKEIQLWDQDCPLCAEGSLSLPARQNWLKLFMK